MAQGRLGVYPGRVKTFPFTWRQGASPSSAPIDCSDAVCSVFSSTFPRNERPTITIVDAVTGEFTLTFSAELTENLKPNNIYRIQVALTFNSDPDYSPDPVVVEIVVL